MQRLYSTFARGWPAAGLLCLRLAAAIAALGGVSLAWGSGGPAVLAIAEFALSLLIGVGLWTPIAGAALAVAAVWRGHLLLAAIGLALAMLGPGAWSVDARLFGRKRLIHDP